MSPMLHDRRVAQILSRQGKATVVAPVTVDMQIAQPHALVAKTQLLDDPKARGVLGSDVDFDPMKSQPEKRVVARSGQGERHDPLSRNGFGDPVSRTGRPQGAPRDPEQ